MDPNTILRIATAPKTDSKRWRNGVITWGELVAKLSTPSDHKECGNYVLGRLSGDRRSKTTIQSRGALTLDADAADGTAIVEALEVLGYIAVVHTTYQSAPDQMRLRVIILLDRDVAPDEYHAIAGAMINLLGAEQFDPSSVQPERFMYLPSAQNPDWFQVWVLDGEPASADDLLKDWDPDLTKRPTPRTWKKNPLELGGVVGSFNRAFSIEEAIEAFELPYEPAGDGRWHLVGAKAIAGLNLIAEGIVFSHHVTDPACGRACSAFDLVRLHRYGHLDEDSPPDTPINRLPSNLAMEEEFRSHPKIIGDVLGEDFSDLGDEESWKLNLDLDRQGRLKNTVQNWDLLRDNEPILKSIYFNEMTLAIETDLHELPWREVTETRQAFTSVDSAELRQHLERSYRMIGVTQSRVEEAVSTMAHRRWRNPVREWLLGLKWDGTPRVETCLPGVKATPHARMVARKCLVAAVARMLDPGCKWDHSLILFGGEGVGKTHWLETMSRGHYASLGNIGAKDTLITMQSSWILISDEGHSLSKADADVQKEFLTRTKDVFRMPYDREAMAHPRHFVIWGSTNDQVFLRRMEGNRRFLIVKCESKVDFDLLTEEYVEQVWAEAVVLYQKGEKLFLDDAESLRAGHERESFTEEDVLRGMIQEFVDRPVPMNWSDMAPDERYMWTQDSLNRGEVLQNQICSMQVWCEVLGRRKGDHQRGDLINITKALHDLPGWRPLEGRHRVSPYGPQLVFERTDRIERDLNDLL